MLGTRETMHLGITLNYKADRHAEVTQKLQEVNKTLREINNYWKAAEASKKLKILIFEAVLKAGSYTAWKRRVYQEAAGR